MAHDIIPVVSGQGTIFSILRRDGADLGGSAPLFVGQCGNKGGTMVYFGWRVSGSYGVMPMLTARSFLVIPVW